jgi:hypothetical protein
VNRLFEWSFCAVIFEEGVQTLAMSGLGGLRKASSNS